jgi:hypothetical protein
LKGFFTTENTKDTEKINIKTLCSRQLLLHSPQGCGECREMTGSFPARAVVRDLCG